MRVIMAIRMGCVAAGFLLAAAVTESYELETIGTMDYLRGMGMALVFLAAGIERRKRWKKKKRFE